MGLPRCRSTTGCTSSASNREDFILLLARRERIVNPMAGCEKVLYAIRPAMAAEGVSMGVNRFYSWRSPNFCGSYRASAMPCAVLPFLKQ